MLASVALPLIFAACDLADVFSSGSDSWKEPAVDFVVDRASDGFAFASEKRDIAVCMKRGAVAWKGFEVWEARVYFGEDGVRRVEMSLYNRGDGGDSGGLDDKALKDMVERVSKAVDPKIKPGRTEQTELKSGGSQYERRWAKTDPNVELAWGVSKGSAKERRADFVRLTLSPKSTKPKGATRSVSGQAAAAKVKANVSKNSDGDVWIGNVPMVDQGQKGYCAAACVERILRYYGHDIDEHEIAQMAGTSARGGTMISDMVETVKTVGSKCRLGFQSVVSMSGSMDDLEKEIEQYNKAAKSEKERELKLGEFMRGNTVLVGEIYAAMRPKVIKKMRVKDARFKKFLSGVKTQIDKGIPLFWGVTLGIFPEPGLPQTIGGHIRLVIGYNQKTKEILYTDSWGAGHELKRMPEDWAFAITHDAFFLKPL